MRSTFRISFGNALARNYKGKDESILSFCQKLGEKVDYLRSLSFSQLSKFNVEETETVRFQEKEACITVFIEKAVDGEDMLVAVQCYYPTWSSPNHISFSGLAKVLVDGFIIKDDGEILGAKDEDLYPFT